MLGKFNKLCIYLGDLYILLKGLNSYSEVKHLFNLALPQIFKITEPFVQVTSKEESLGNLAPRQIGQVLSWWSRVKNTTSKAVDMGLIPGWGTEIPRAACTL